MNSKLVANFLIVIAIIGCGFPSNVLDHNGNPIFNSVALFEEDYENYSIASNYYTISGNIANPNSSVYMTDSPSMDDVAEFSMKHPSYFWLLHKDRVVLKMILLNEIPQKNKRPQWEWLIIDTDDQSSVRIPVVFPGSITEHRYLEVTNSDSLFSKTVLAAEDEGKGFKLGQYFYAVLSYNKIYAELERLIEVHKLYDPETNVKDLSQIINS